MIEFVIGLSCLLWCIALILIGIRALMALFTPRR